MIFVTKQAHNYNEIVMLFDKSNYYLALVEVQVAENAVRRKCMWMECL